MANEDRLAPMPTPPAPPTLECVGITAWIDFGSRTEKATFYGTIVGDRQVWPAADRIAAWLHETALRLFPDSPYAKSHTDQAGIEAQADKRRQKLARSRRRRFASCANSMTRLAANRSDASRMMAGCWSITAN